MRKRLKIGQEVVVIRFDYKTHKETMEKGKVVAILERIINLPYSEKIAVAFKDGQIEKIRTVKRLHEMG